MSKKEIVKNEEMPVVEFDENYGSGFEESDKDAFAIPFIRILQTNSNQANEDEESYIEGAKPGMFYNTVSNALYGKEITVIPVHYARSFIEWMPDRGGFVTDHKNNLSIYDQAAREGSLNLLPNGHIITDTRNHFIIVVGEAPDAGIFSLTSTNIKHSKKWMSNMKNLRLPNGKSAPMFSSYYKMKSVLNKNDQGTWYGIGDKQVTAIERIGWIDKKYLASVSDFREMVLSNKIDVDYNQTQEEPYSDNEPGF